MNERLRPNPEELKIAFVSAYPFGVNGGVQDNIRNSARILSEEFGQQEDRLKQRLFLILLD